MNPIHIVRNFIDHRWPVGIIDIQKFWRCHPLEISFKLNWYGFLRREFDAYMDVQTYATDHPDDCGSSPRGLSPEMEKRCKRLDEQTATANAYLAGIQKLKEAQIISMLKDVAKALHHEYIFDIYPSSRAKEFGSRAVDITDVAIGRVRGSEQLGECVSRIADILNLRQVRNKFLVNPTEGPEPFGPYADAMRAIPDVFCQAQAIWRSGALKEVDIEYDEKRTFEEWSWTPAQKPSINKEDLEEIDSLHAIEVAWFGTINGRKL